MRSTPNVHIAKVLGAGPTPTGPVLSLGGILTAVELACFTGFSGCQRETLVIGPLRGFDAAGPLGLGELTVGVDFV